MIDSHQILSHGVNIAILGYGREGKSTLAWLLQHGVPRDSITILDRSGIDLPPDIRSFTWNTYARDLHVYDIIIKSPGISPLYDGIGAHSDRITSQTQIFMDLAPWPIIGVTGTKGKSTTATLIARSLRHAGRSIRLVGNIGAPVLSEIDLRSHYDAIVYEMSSYMLHHLRHSLYTAVLLDIYPDHLDWHGGFEAYRDAKLGALKGARHAIVGSQVFSAGHLRQEGTTYVHADGTPIECRDIRIAGAMGEYTFADGFFSHGDVQLFDDTSVRLLGDHNRHNIAVVIGAIDTLRIDLSSVRKAVEGFEGLPHRIERVGEYHGIEFFDDAISTTPESTMEAMSALRGRIGTIMLGGEDRGYDFRMLAQRLEEDGIMNIILFPNSGKRILPLLSPSHRIHESTDMEDAVRWAYKNTPSGTVCLLSCASPSYSLWRDFEHKAEEYIRWIHALAESDAPPSREKEL